MNEGVSIIIPAREEKYLEQTIRSVLQNAEGDIEVLIVLDGWIPNPQIVTNDERVVFIHNPESIGQRASINLAARQAKGKYVMKLDAHCAVDKGFDVKLKADCKYDWTVVPTMFNLDIKTFTPKLHKKTQYMYIGWNEKNELRSLYYRGSEWKKWHSRTQELDETMGLMGPCFFMHKDRFWELGGCDEAHGSWGQQGIEVACKAWLSGGKLIVNKKTWFAHWFRGDVGFPYPISGHDVDKAREYSKNLWLQNKWPGQKRDFQWLVNKFSPPTWENTMNVTNVDELNDLFYKHIHLRKVDCKWKDTRLIKMPTDVMLYHKVIWEKKPDIIIDSGTKFGGSALFFQDMLDMVGNGGKVITIDKFPSAKEKDPRITYIEDGSTSEATLKRVKEMVEGKSVMVVLDSDHTRRHVKRELYYYSDIVTSGQYLVIEDCYMYDKGGCRLAGPGEARDWFLARSRKLEQTNLDQAYLIGFVRGGWLIKK